MKQAKVSDRRLRSALAHIAVKVAELEKQVARFKESEKRHSDWMWEAKRKAGYNNNVSFDVVFENLLTGKKPTSHQLSYS